MSKGAPRAGAQAAWPLGIGAITHNEGAQVALAATAAVLCYAAAELGLALHAPESAIPAMWAPIGVLVALLLLTPYERWWIVLASAAFGYVAAHWRSGVDLAAVPSRLLHDLALAAIVGFVVRRTLASRNPFDSPRDLVMYVALGVVATPSLTAIVGPEVLQVLRAPGRESAAGVWLTSALSYSLPLLTLTPAVYLGLQRGVGWLRAARPRRYLEALLIGFALFFIYMRVAAEDAPHQALLYLFLLPLLWAAARFGVKGAAAAATIGVVMWTSANIVPEALLMVGAGSSGLLDLQIYLFVASLTALILGAASEERMRSARALAESELRYRTIVETQTELVCRNLPDTTLTFVNEAYCRFFRQSRAQLVGSKWIDLLPPESHAAVLASLARLSRTNPLLVHEHEVLLPDGRTGWMQWVDTAIFDEAGQIIEVQGVGRDLTDLKRVERSLRDSDQRFQLVLRATKDVIYDWDIVHNKLWSSAHGDWLQTRAPRQHSTLEEWSHGLHESDRDRYLADLAAVLRSADDYWEIEYRYSRDGGPTQHVHERACILRDARGAAVRMIGSVADITDRKRLEETREALAHVARLATVGEISASIAHEVNQPLAAIINNAETALAMLLRNQPEETAEIVADIREDGLRASDIVRRLASLLRGQEPTFTTLAIDDVVLAAVSLLQGELRRRRAHLNVRCEAHANVMGDAARLQQVMLNLVLNALDATSDGPEGRRRITVQTHSTPHGAVQIDVIDRGVGVPEEQLSTIFDSFVTTKANGMGLGLSVTRSILHAHGGRIWAANNANGEGATFSCELPAATAAGARETGSDALGRHIQH